MFTIYYQKVSTCDETICTNFTIEPEKDTKNSQENCKKVIVKNSIFFRPFS